jgi:hypothetical protein
MTSATVTDRVSRQLPKRRTRQSKKDLSPEPASGTSGVVWDLSFLRGGGPFTCTILSAAAVSSYSLLIGIFDKVKNRLYPPVRIADRKPGVAAFLKG